MGRYTSRLIGRAASALGRVLSMADSGDSNVWTRASAWQTFWGEPPAGEISEQSALTYSAVWGCVALISEAMGVMGWHLYDRLADGGKQRRSGDSIDRLLSVRPNPDMSSQTFRETLQAWALTHGNGYAEIERANGRPVALWPRSPDRVLVDRNSAGEIVYKVRDKGEAEPRVVFGIDMFHLHGLGYDGLTGYSVIKMAKHAIELGRHAEQFGRSFFKHGIRPSGGLEHPSKLSDPAYQRLKASLESHAGSSETGRNLILEEGMTWKPWSIPPEDAQFLETRVFQKDDICVWYRVPKVMLGSLENATLHNVEQMYIQFARGTILPWAVKWEQEADAKLVDDPDQFTKLNINALQRADIKTRYEAYAIGRQWGWVSADDVRENEDMNPLPDGNGKLYLTPINMAVVGQTPPASAGSSDMGGMGGRNSAPGAADVKAAMTPAFADAASRIIEKEVKASLKATAKHAADAAAFKVWSERFWAGQRQQWADTVMPLMQSLCRMLAGPIDADSTLRFAADRHAESHATLCETTLAHAFGQRTVEGLCETWSVEGAAVAAARMIDDAVIAVTLAAAQTPAKETDDADA